MTSLYFLVSVGHGGTTTTKHQINVGAIGAGVSKTGTYSIFPCPHARQLVKIQRTGTFILK